MPSRPSQRAAALDLTVAVAFFFLCSIFEPTLDPILRRGRGLVGVLALAGYQFACEGLAPIVILAVRRERPSDYGFARRHVGQSLGLALALAMLYDLALSWHAGALLWIPLRRQPATRIALAAGLPVSLVGLGVTVAVWGLLEGFFGVFFAKKVNDALGHRGRGWLSPGAWGFALFNALIHLAIGQGAEGFVWSFASGYAIGLIPALTANAWGSGLVQTLTNAVGRL